MTMLFVEYGDIYGRLCGIYIQGEPNKDIETLIMEQMPALYDTIKEIYDVTTIDDLL